jgi:hypothetical protein
VFKDTCEGNVQYSHGSLADSALSLTKAFILDQFAKNASHADFLMMQQCLHAIDLQVQFAVVYGADR